MTFAGRSYAKWKLQHSTKKRFSLRFRLRTRQASAVLMFAKGKLDYSILKVDRSLFGYLFYLLMYISTESKNDCTSVIEQF